MTNGDLQAAWDYHNRTKHTVARLRANRHHLEWEIKPRPFKIYPGLEAIPLPRELPSTRVPALAALARREPVHHRELVPDLVSLARVLHFSAGITRRKVYPGGEEMYFRAPACTGALYHIDLYLICAELPGLSAGVYHFGVHDFSLTQLRAGDHRGVVAAATGAEPSAKHAPVIVACASTYWRNSWKYQARTYRHCFWDCGTVLANLLATTAADDVPTRIISGFVDTAVDDLLALDAEREATVALVSLGRQSESAPPEPDAVPALALETLPLSPRQVDYPEIREMHAASRLRSAEEVRAWRAAGKSGVRPAPPVSGSLSPLWPLAEGTLPIESIDQVILRRGSTRHFAQRPIGFDQLSTLLQRASRDVPADWGESSTDIYVIANAVEGLAPGAYVYRRYDDALELLRAGEFRQEAGYLGLGQDLPADASVNIYFLADLDPILRRFGNRGYRVAQLDAAIRGGKCYLAAYALGLGATGLTFFDDDVTEFFAPHAAGKSVMFLVAVGRGRKAPVR